MPKMKRTSGVDGLATSRSEFSQGTELIANVVADLERVRQQLLQAAGRFFGGAADAAADV